MWCVCVHVCVRVHVCMHVCLLYLPQNYILAICHPEQTTQVSCQGQPHLDDLVLENVERMTSAYLLRTGSQSLQVMGSELACMLAISQLELTYHITMASKEARVGITTFSTLCVNWLTWICFCFYIMPSQPGWF